MKKIIKIISNTRTEWWSKYPILLYIHFWRNVYTQELLLTREALFEKYIQIPSSEIHNDDLYIIDNMALKHSVAVDGGAGGDNKVVELIFNKLCEGLVTKSYC